MSKHKNKSAQDKSARIVVFGLIGVGLLLAVLLKGKDAVLFNPKGEIAQQQSHLMIFSISVFMLVAVPTLAMLYFFAWKYRETNSRSRHDPSRRLGKFAAAGLWVIPIITIYVLSTVVLPATHKLDPHKAIVSGNRPLTIQVIALRWKWLFVYPEQNIATVNYVQLPVNTPVQFELTADEAPMNSFWIPHLGGQLYAMTGHSNLLNLMADSKGDYSGQAAEINGPGFAGMKFSATVTSSEDFNQWVQKVQLSSHPLDSAGYSNLLAPSENNPPSSYSAVQRGLYDKVLMKYMGSHSHTESQ